jgi:multiple antibiotic resistance protein
VTAIAIRSFLTLFIVLDPVGLAPLFLGLTGNRTAEERAVIARRAVAVAAIVMVIFGVAGSWLLEHLGITLDAFRIAGGILLFRIAIEMIFVRLERETAAEAHEARMKDDISVFPLAIPLIAGPGALASIMILASEGLREHVLGMALVLTVCAFVLLLVYLGLRLATPIEKILGQTGINVITRVLGVILAALATQYVVDGIKALFHIA